MSTRLLVAFVVLLVLPTMIVEEFHARRLRGRGASGFPTWWHHRQLAKAADRAIAAALSTASPGELVLVTVEDVQWRAYRDFGLGSVPRHYAAEVLRERLNRHRGRLDIVSDLDIDEPPR